MRHVVLAGALIAALPVAACSQDNSGNDAAREASARPENTGASPGMAVAPLDDGPRQLLTGKLEPRQAGPWAPSDECGGVPGANPFRLALAHAVLALDADAIAAMALPGVRLGFGGDDGRDRFREALAAPDGKLLGELREVLSLGCAPDRSGNLVMPAYFARDPGDIDMYSAMLVTGADVPLLAEGKAGAKMVRVMSWEVVSLDGDLQADKPYQRVKASDGAAGWVAGTALRSLLDYRLLATRDRGEWKISAFLAGD
ncbi:MAG: hypothetical protein M0R03_22245 [Novosphingobium sp.]|nr:hypothetical protein [Novosphingobium sp.]